MLIVKWYKKSDNNQISHPFPCILQGVAAVILGTNSGKIKMELFASAVIKFQMEKLIAKTKQKGEHSFAEQLAC